MTARHKYLTYSGSGDHLSNEGSREFHTLVGAYDHAYDASLSWSGYILIKIEFDNDPDSRSTVAMFKNGVRQFESE